MLKFVLDLIMFLPINFPMEVFHRRGVVQYELASYRTVSKHSTENRKLLLLR